MYFSDYEAQKKLDVNEKEYSDVFKCMEKLTSELSSFMIYYDGDKLRRLVEYNQQQAVYEREMRNKSALKKAFSSKPKKPYGIDTMVNQFNKVSKALDDFRDAARFVSQEQTRLLSVLLDTQKSNDAEEFRVALRQYEAVLREIR